MYTIALVQNQSEMSHYACADARPLLGDYDYRLFTGDDIVDLAPALARRQVHAVILGSNALNDKDILATLCNPDFAKVLGEFLKAGRGFLSMQQIGLAMRKGPTMSVLPSPYDRLLPTVTPPGDTTLRSGRLDISSSRAPHITLTYPNEIDLESVRTRALGFRGYQGLYWHYWEQVDLADWDQVLVDPTAPAIRSLVLASKESSPGRVVVSALPLDWQKHEDLFHNLLVYVVEGRHSLATLSLQDDDSFDYLRRTLRARRQPYGQYVLPDDADGAARNVGLGIHSTVLVGPGLSGETLPDPLRANLRTAMHEGRVRLVDVGSETFGIRGMTVISHELRPRHLLVSAEMQIQTELREGYVDDSFWSHVETLQTLELMPDRLVRYAGLQRAAFAITANHDRGGSYDELFGPTCALYWLRATYLGVQATGTEETAAWLRRQIPEQEPADRALAYLAFAAVQQLRADEQADLEAVVRGFDLAELSESQLVLQLRAALTARISDDDVADLASALVDRQNVDHWIDLTTTATAANALLDVRARLLASGSHTALVASIDDSVRAAVILILRELAASEASAEPTPYPWEGKARTTTKCLQAWLKFDALQDLPVHELVENLERAHLDANNFATSRTTLAVLQDISEDNQRLRDENKVSATALLRASALRTRSRWAAVAGVIVVYALVTLTVGLAIASKDVRGGVRTGFVNGWAVHSAVAGLVITVLGFLPAVRKWVRGHTPT